jgi:plasmid stabilization system protein ParE
MLRVVFRPAARADLREAFAWYERQEPGLGQRFLEAVDATLERVRANPRVCAVLHGDVRSVRLARFPYAVLYRERPGRLVVLAVFHGHRDPGQLQRRIENE